MMLGKWWQNPQHIFMLFSFIFGLPLIFLIPPIGGIDESNHIRRVSEVSEFILLSPKSYTEDPFSLWAENALAVRKEYYMQKKSWNFADIKKIGTEQPQERAVQIEKNIPALNSPVIYLPFAFVLKSAKILFQPDYWQQFYILRITALIISVALFAAAIARMPEHKILLAAAALLPVMFYNRSGLNVDGLTIGCAALFLVQLHNLCHKNGIISFFEKLHLIFWGFLLAQSKGVYSPLLFLVFLLPKENFNSRRGWWLTIILTIIPALLCGFGWSGYAKLEVLTGAKYFTGDGGEVWPDGQFAWILQHPFSFALVLLKTVFATSFIPNSILQMVGHLGWNGFAISILPTVIIMLLFFAIAASEPVISQLYNLLIERLVLLGFCAATFVLMLTMLYVQWTGYQSEIVYGFQGRYFYPLLPILVVFVKPIKELESSRRAIILLWVFGLVSSASVLWTTYSGNY